MISSSILTTAIVFIIALAIILIRAMLALAGQESQREEARERLDKLGAQVLDE